jgi:TonB family protein
MKKELARGMLAAAILIPPTSLAGQSAQHDSGQTNASQITPATPDRKPKKVYHIGGDIKPPRVISSFQPSLDEEHIRQLRGKKVAKTGSTVVGIIVGENGAVWSARVLESFNRDLDAKAIDAVKQWKFEPALKKGVPVAVELAVKVDFQLYK